MQYMLLVYGDEQLWESLARDEATLHNAAHRGWFHEIVMSGNSRGAVALHPVTTATTLREANGRIAIADGPANHSGAVLGAVQIVECDDLDEAIAIASTYAPLRYGFSMEVRPVVSQ